MPMPKEVAGMNIMRTWPESSCTCEKCVKCCERNTPGWFLPDEVQKVADFLQMSITQMLGVNMIVEYWYDSNLGQMEVVTPIMTFQIGQVFARFGDPIGGGQCIFLKHNRCRIYEVRPFECRLAHACQGTSFTKGYRVRKSIAWQWRRRKVNAWKLMGGEA